MPLPLWFSGLSAFPCRVIPCGLKAV